MARDVAAGGLAPTIRAGWRSKRAAWCYASGPHRPVMTVDKLVTCRIFGFATALFAD